VNPTIVSCLRGEYNAAIGRARPPTRYNPSVAGGKHCSYNIPWKTM
jgi:hypothetical protein